MHRTLGAAVYADAGTVYLGKPVDVVKLNAELRGNARTHFVAPSFGADHTLLQAYLIPDTSFGDLLRKKERVRRSGTKHGRFHIDHHSDLLVGVAGTHRDRHCAELLASELESDPRRPQTVSGGYVYSVELRYSRHFVASRKHQRPIVYILLGVGDYYRCTRCSRG